MKLQPSEFLKLATLGAACITLIQTSNAATVLTGVIEDGIANNGDETNKNLQPTHGSNAPGTPDIAVTWAPTGAPNVSTSGRWQIYHAWPNGGSVYQLDALSNGYNGTLNFSISLVPSSGTTAVRLTSISLNNWAGGPVPNTTLNWNVTGSISGIFGSGTALSVPNGTVVPLDFGYQGVGGETLTLNLIPTGGTGSYFAVDNLSFDQVTVPEPSGAILAGLGLGALAMRRRR